MLHNGSELIQFNPCKEGEKQCHTTRRKPIQNLVNEFTNI
jgi:hypothetical protein